MCEAEESSSHISHHTSHMKIRNAALVAALAAPVVAGAQTDYFNTDRGRPLHVQDAAAIERFAFELQVAPLRWSGSNGRGVWSLEPELAYGTGDSIIVERYQGKLPRNLATSI